MLTDVTIAIMEKVLPLPVLPSHRFHLLKDKVNEGSLLIPPHGRLPGFEQVRLLHPCTILSNMLLWTKYEPQKNPFD